MKLLGGLLGANSPNQKIVADDLKRLNSVKADLGDQAIDYVCSGSGETVLSSLSTLCKSNELEVCCPPYVDRGSPIEARRRLFARADPYDLDLIQRYAEVLNAATSTVEAAGTGAVPKPVRIFLSEGFLGIIESPNTWPRKAVPLEGKGLILEHAVAMVQRLGGELADFFDVLYAKAERYGGINGNEYRSVVDLCPLFEGHPAALIKAASRIPIAARIELLRDLAELRLGKSQTFAEFLVAQAGEGSKAVREAAISAVAPAPLELIEPIAIRLLQSGDATEREGMVNLLARLGTAGAVNALKAHSEAEKTARIVTAIDTALLLVERRHMPTADADDASGYKAIDGRHIDIPPAKPVAEGESPRFGQSEQNELKETIAKENERLRKYQEENERRGYKYKVSYLEEKLAKEAVDFFNSASPSHKGKDDLIRFLAFGAGRKWTIDALAKFPDRRALDLVRELRCGGHVFNFHYGPGSERILTYLNGPEGDLRTLESDAIEAGATFEYGSWGNKRSRPFERGDLLRFFIHEDSYSSAHSAFLALPNSAVWPYLAENLDVFDEALGLKPQGAVKLDRVAAIRPLTLLPATPARYFAPLLEAATGETKAGRAEARAMLNKAPGVEERLVALLDDSRQSVRAGTAEWLSVRRDASAVQVLSRRLKKEKSDVARAAILTALKRLGEDLSKTLGPKALLAEAEKGLKSAKFDKLEWMGLGNLPRMHFSGSSSVPSEVLRWWVFLAFKLKQPGGNALFQIYLDQLQSKDAEAFSTFILDSWLAYDTARPKDADANVHAKANASRRYEAVIRWDKEYTEERAFADLKREFLSQYLNSGADTKGVLALAARASSAVAADRVRAYLKNHGSRTSQACALLEMLANIGDPVALQVVIAAATRLKQKSVQALAKDLITKVAEARDWTLDELADRTIPTASFDEDGILQLLCGEDAKLYEARLKGDLSIVLQNPSGKEVASLPSGQDEATAASKKQLATTKKELKQIIAMQSARLYEALCAERAWPASDWMRHFHEHPVMRRLVERVVWLGLDADGKVTGAFRPTAEGDFTDASDDAADISQFARICLAHGALLDAAGAKAWEQHLADYEIKPLFQQFGRSLMKVAPEKGGKTLIEDRKGWVTDAFTIRGAAAKLGYERGPALDGGFFNEYRKSFLSAALTAVVEFTGNGLPEQNVTAALISLTFEKASVGPGQFSRAVKLSEVPPVLLSECWNDYHAMAAKAAYDAEWEKKSPW